MPHSELKWLPRPCRRALACLLAAALLSIGEGTESLSLRRALAGHIPHWNRSACCCVQRDCACSCRRKTGEIPSGVLPADCPHPMHPAAAGASSPASTGICSGAYGVESFSGPSLDVIGLGQLRHVDTPVSQTGYFRFGSGAAGRPALLLIPPFASTMAFWPMDFLEVLSRTQEVILFDLSGIGTSKVRWRAR